MEKLNVKTVNLIAKVKGSNPVLAFFMTAKEAAMIFFTFNSSSHISTV